ncbi:retrovirus-related pol polyprotein from transposon TNT 1-94 [Tanacetum coccineum]
MDVKSAFLNGFINEEVCMAQSLGFIEFEKANHVYKLKKSLYGLKQAPKAWYDRLKAFLIKHEYKGMVDNTLFTKKKGSNLIIVQIYVDDIIFGSTCQELCDDFAKIIHNEFKMSMMGELNFFIGLQLKQMEDGIFFNQSKYILEMLKKFGLKDSKPIKTTMSLDTKLTKDEECESIDSTKYRGMIGVIHSTNISRPPLRSTQMQDKVGQNKNHVMFRKKDVEDHHRISSLSNKTKFVTACNDSLNVKNSNVKVVCVTCDKCVFNSNHGACVSKFINDVNARTKKPHECLLKLGNPQEKRTNLLQHLIRKQLL